MDLATRVAEATFKAIEMTAYVPAAIAYTLILGWLGMYIFYTIFPRPWKLEQKEKIDRLMVSKGIGVRWLEHGSVYGEGQIEDINKRNKYLTVRDSSGKRVRVGFRWICYLNDEPFHIPGMA